MEPVAGRSELNSHRWLARAVWAVALVALLYLAALTLWLAGAGLLFPYQLDYGEGFLLHFVREWSLGNPIYKPAEGYPYVMANYPPLLIVLALALTPLLGLGYAAGRVWTLLAILALAGLAVAWVRREGGRWLPAVAAALLLVGSPYIYDWAPLFRVDLVGLSLTVGGLYVVAIAYPPASPAGPAGEAEVGPHRRFHFWLAAVLFVAALYAKQSFLFAPAAALAYLWLVGRRRTALGLALALALLGGGLFLLLNLLTRGGFWYGLVASNVNPFVWPEFWKQQADFWARFAVLGLLTAWYVVDKFVLRRSRPVAAGLSPLDLYLPASLASLWLAGKAGAWENYFFEALAALALCAGLGMARLMDRRHPLLGAVVPLLVLLQVGLAWHTPRTAERYLRLTRQANEAMIPILAATPDPIAAEDMGLLVTNGKILDYCSFQYSQLARAGRWDQAWELGRLRQRAYNLVILERGTRLDVDRYQRFTREFLSELDRNYRHARSVGKYELYEPAPLQRERPVAFGPELALAGWSVEGVDPTIGVAPGQPLTLTVLWQAQQAPGADYTAFAHLVDATGRGWAGADHQPHDGLYPTGRWAAGEMVRDLFTLTVPADAPPGLYDLVVGWYEPVSGERLPAAGATSARLAVVPVAWTGTTDAAAAALTPARGASFGPALNLEGYGWQIEPGAVRLTLRWSAADYPPDDYTVFVHLVAPGQDGPALAQGDGPPLAGRWPTSLWLPGLTLDDEHLLPLPADLPAGEYDLLVGLYDPATGQRLRLADGRDALRLTGLDLKGTEP